MMKKFLYLLVGLSLLILTACATHSEETTTYSLACLEPAAGAYFGVNLDWEQDNAAAFNQRLGIQAAVYVGFFHFPFGNSELDNLDNFIEQVAQQQGLALITLEPHNGLNTVTPTIANDLAERLASYNQRGVPIFVRFAHEMNGSWYPWSQCPTQYIQAFRTLAEAIHRYTHLTAMIWAPNYGGGYPFAGGRYEALPDTSEFELLDTNHDGQLNMLDDMYAPYYPGDDVVDWAGMSVYHWGNQHPWGENEVPEEGSFVARITGTYIGLDGDQRSVPNFYHIYVEEHHKPMAITETAALYNPAIGGASEQSIKQNWWRQVFDPQVARDFPRIKMINWFEWRKSESEVGGVIDWSVTLDPELAKAFLKDLPCHRLIFATDLNDALYRK